ncbi:claudin 15-like a [Danio rerio]|uniref:Claudin n=1 Tax=Danio rerio TaxID=7955 RepID=B8JLG4_DANRE|nr:claudin 15-like a [Danio rerio]|eukprot:NP_571846.2 claudin 15-like a [Danio rerio]
MSTALEVTGYFMCLIGWVLTGLAVANDYWKISSIQGNVIVSNRLYENLWHACGEDSTGKANCQDFQSMLALPVHIQACRALVIIALLLGLVGLVLSTMGLNCIKIGSKTDESKGKNMFIGGIIYLIGGLCTMVGVSWYAARVVQEFNDPFYGGVRFELGSGLYIGWAGAALCMLGGGFQCSAYQRFSKSKEKGAYYPAGKPQTIYTTAQSNAETSKAYV